MAVLEWLIHEVGLHSLVNTGSRDVYIVLLLRFLRMFAYGGAALLLGILLYTRGSKGTEIGTFLTLVLVGDAGISYLLTVKADSFGRRRVLMIGSLLMAIAGVVFATIDNYYVLLIAAILGVISPGAHEMGPFRAIHESILAQLTPLEARTDVYAWFAIASTVGMASGLFVSGWTTYLIRTRYDLEWKDSRIYSSTFWCYAALGLLKLLVTLTLSDKCEPDAFTRKEADAADRESTSPLLNNGYRKTPKRTMSGKAAGAAKGIWKQVTVTLSPESRGILLRLCLLFALNSFASSMLPVTLMSWYVNYRYRWFVAYRIGYAMSAIWLAASIANLFSASVARRLGLIRAMVLTHLPGALALAFIPLAPTWYSFAVLLLLSSVLGSMDQAPRSAFVAAAFSSNERTAVMGTINMVRTVASTGGPLITGFFHDKELWWATFLLAAALKVMYDMGLLAMFLNTKLPEYENGPREFTVADVDVGILLSENFRRENDHGESEVEGMEDDAPRHLRQDKATYETIEETV